MEEDNSNVTNTDILLRTVELRITILGVSKNPQSIEISIV